MNDYGLDTCMRADDAREDIEPLSRRPQRYTYVLAQPAEIELGLYEQSLRLVSVGPANSEQYPSPCWQRSGWLNLQQEIVMKTLVMLACLLLSASAFAECATNARGETVCGNGQAAGGYNRETGTAWSSERNQNGVRTTQTNRGGEAKTKNGKGVAHGPGGTTCYRTANRHGCD